MSAFAEAFIWRLPTGLFIWKLTVMLLLAACLWPWKGRDRE